jgi:hypothetical protein
LVLGLRTQTVGVERGKPLILFTIHDLPFTAFSDSRFTIYGLTGEMGETILANHDEAPPDILLTAVKAFK